MSTQLLTNPNFDEGTVGWVASDGFGNYSYTSSNKIAVLEGVVYFTYVARTLSQTVSVADIIETTQSFSCIVNIRHRQKGDDGQYTQEDKYYFELKFKDNSGQIVILKRTPTSGYANAPKDFEDVNLSLDRSEIPLLFDEISSVEVAVTGFDSGYWNGNHGPMVEYVTLTSNEITEGLEVSSNSSAGDSSSSSTAGGSETSSSYSSSQVQSQWFGARQMGGHYSITRGIMKRLWPDFFRHLRQR